MNNIIYITQCLLIVVACIAIYFLGNSIARRTGSISALSLWFAYMLGRIEVHIMGIDSLSKLVHAISSLFHNLPSFQ